MNHNRNRQPSRQLRIARPTEIPRTLAELADESNIGASLRKKLGDRAYWLVASEVVGVYRPQGLAVGELRIIPPRLPLAVRYSTTRRFHQIEYIDMFTGEVEPIETEDEEFAVFELLSRPELQDEEEQDRYAHIVETTDEVAVRLGQAVTLLDREEHDETKLFLPNPNVRPHLRLVPYVVKDK